MPNKSHYGTEQSTRPRNNQPPHKCRSLKVGFSSEKIARKERIKQINHGCSVQREYLCDECKHWHLTSQEDTSYNEEGADIAGIRKGKKHKGRRKDKYKVDYITVYQRKHK